MYFELLYASIASFFGGALGSVIGGNSLLIIPALVLLGMSPSSALATNKFIACFTSLVSIIMLGKSSVIIEKKYYLIFLAISFSSFSGALITPNLDQKLLNQLIGWFLVLYGIIFFSGTKFSIPARFSHILFVLFLSLIIGIYGSIIGLGMGPIFYSIARDLLKFSNLKATAFAKWAALSINLPAFLTFAIKFQNVNYHLGSIMLVVSVIGTFVGTKFLLSKSDKIIGYISAGTIFLLGITMIIKA